MRESCQKTGQLRLPEGHKDRPMADPVAVTVQYWPSPVANVPDRRRRGFRLRASACLVNCSGHVVTVGERLETEFS